MSADPFANTTTVKNILQHIISPKIVKQGNGYVTKTDLVNVHNLVFSDVDGARTVQDTLTNPFTAQCGIARIGVINGGKRFTFSHTRVTANSIILANFIDDPSGRYIAKIECGDQEFEVLTSIPLNPAEFLRIQWFIAAF
jgi:hypothetical protein